MSTGDNAGWRPGCSVDVARRRAQLLKRARGYFDEHDILEVDTPFLSPAAVSDPNIDSVTARLAAAPEREYFLHTSPEFAMKRLLCARWPDIGFIGRVFRDGELGRRHQPEFTMIEWYRLGIGFTAMMAHTVDFLAAILDASRLRDEPSYERYDDAFREHAGIDPLHASLDDIIDASDADESLRQALGDDRDAWLDLTLSTRIAPHFASDKLTVLHHYPASQAALARRCPENPDVADRFEIFFGTLELANGYCELTDARELAARFCTDNDRRQAAGRRTRPVDAQLLSAMQSGLPPCCGVAVGFERLLMIAVNSDDIRTVMPFAHRESAQ